jgi:hypothetical protein
MKNIIVKFVLFALSINTINAQSSGELFQNDEILEAEIKKEMAIDNGLEIIRILFEGSYQNVNQNVKCRSYYWCEFCESKIGCCQTFMESYKKHFTNELLNKLEASDLDVNLEEYEKEKSEYYDLSELKISDKTREEDTIITVQKMSFYYQYYDEEGNRNGYQFEFEKSDSYLQPNWFLVSVSEYN